MFTLNSGWNNNIVHSGWDDELDSVCMVCVHLGVCVCSCVCDCGRPILESLQIWKQTPVSSRISLKDPNSSQIPMTSCLHNLLQETGSFKRKQYWLPPKYLLEYCKFMKEKMEKQSRNKKRPTDFTSSTSPAILFVKSEKNLYYE